MQSPLTKIFNSIFKELEINLKLFLFQRFIKHFFICILTEIKGIKHFLDGLLSDKKKKQFYILY